MSAVEEIQAAIDRLTALRDNATMGVWSLHENPMVVVSGEWGVVEALNYEDDPALIVTLHRTIDAQLSILNRFAEYRSLWMEESAMALAKAIIGGTK